MSTLVQTITIEIYEGDGEKCTAWVQAHPECGIEDKIDVLRAAADALETKMRQPKVEKRLKRVK